MLSIYVNKLNHWFFSSVPLGWVSWDPPREAFTLPFFDIPIMWYGILFASGFISGYFILLFVLQHQRPGSLVPKELCIRFADRLSLFIIGGTVVGARLGHVFFYDWPYYAAHPLEILMIRNGGLASHGGTLGVMIGLVLFLKWMPETVNAVMLDKSHKKSSLGRLWDSFVSLMDLLVIPTAVTAVFIRIANFFNQEIVGNETSLPWGVVFGHAADGTAPLPRHPVQLYEALAYLLTFLVLILVKKGRILPRGMLSGLFFILVFGSRFFLEFLKAPQFSWLDLSTLQAGQLLSLPFILFGFYLVFKTPCIKKYFKLIG